MITITKDYPLVHISSAPTSEFPNMVSWSEDDGIRCYVVHSANTPNEYQEVLQYIKDTTPLFRDVYWWVPASYSKSS